MQIDPNQNNSFNTSVNIIRDADRELTYHKTPNAEKVVNQIVNDFKKGVRAFSIIGSYGTGKSALLWAIEQSLQKKKIYFEINLISNPTVKFINILGDYKSLIESFADNLQVDTFNDTNFILSEIYNRYHDLKSKKPLLVIVIDEFGKFLEYAAQNNPEKELYFIQKLAEFVNNPDYNICLLTTIHQNFDAYAYSLNETLQKEWKKVKGRFREITFNEPVEQLLLLAAKHLNTTTDDQLGVIIEKSLDRILSTKSLRFDRKFAQEIAQKLYPLDMLAANVLTVSLQKYGQNERSLFSFLESTDYTGINNFKAVSHKQFYNVANVYDYLIYNYYSYLNSKNNSDYAAWSGIRIALEKIDGLFDTDIEPYYQLVKTIGLLGINTNSGAILDYDFLVDYARTFLAIKKPEKCIDDLTVKKVISYRAYNTRYVLLDGTDLDIYSAINQASNKVDEIIDIVTYVGKYYNLPHVFTKMYSYKTGTPRFFEYKISDSQIDKEPIGEIDGFINLIFNEKCFVEDIKKQSSNTEGAIIYGYYKNVKKVKEQLFEIEKTKKVIEDNQEDRVAVKELKKITENHQRLLNHYILDAFYSGEVTWIFNGEEKIVRNQKDFNKLLSQICFIQYPKTPTFKNELANKHRVSTSINLARKNYFDKLVNNWHSPDLGFSKELFPPEKTIYLTLIKENGIQLYSGENNFISEVAKDSTFRQLWEYCNDFLNTTQNSQRKVSELMDLLAKRPFKLKQGLIDLWIPTFLFIRRDDFALFGDGIYIPNFSKEVMDLISKAPQRYAIKAFDLEGIKLDLFNRYRVLINQNTKEKIDNQSFIETIKPFIAFYKDLPVYSQSTKNLNKETIAIRGAIANAKDPEKTFFEDFPIALGYSIDSLQSSNESLENYSNRLQEAIRELRTSFDSLVSRFENIIIADFIGEIIPFEEYKKQLQNRFKQLQKPLLIANQKTFIQRLDSPLDDRKMWLSSIAQALTGKSLEMFRDEDEALLYDRFKRMILDLDTLTTISQTDLDADKEDMVGLEISSFVDGINKSLVRFPKSKQPQVTKIETIIRTKLSGDKSLDIAALTNILKELLKK